MAISARRASLRIKSWGVRMTESGLQRIAFNLLLALTLYIALTGGG